MDGRDVGPRERVGYHVVFSTDMSHVGGKLAYEGHVASLTGRTLDGAGEGEGLMVSEYGELVAFDMVAKVFYSEEDAQQLGGQKRCTSSQHWRASWRRKPQGTRCR